MYLQIIVTLKADSILGAKYHEKLITGRIHFGDYFSLDTFSAGIETMKVSFSSSLKT